MAESTEANDEKSKAVVRTTGPRAEGQVAPTRGAGTEVGSIPIDSNHVGALLEEAADARSLPVGDVARAAFRDAKEDINLLRDRLDHERARCDSLRDDLAEARTKIAVLETQIEGIKDKRRLKSWLFGLGGVLAGAGLSAVLTVGSATVPGGVLLAVGLLMMWVGRPALRGEE